MPTNEERFQRLGTMRAEALLGGGPERIEQQHGRGKLTARERLELLLDPGSFVELDAFVTHRSRGLRPGRASSGTGSSRATARSTADSSSSSARTSRSSAARSPRRTPRRSEGHGPRDEGRRADHRPQRFRRRADPGGCRLAGRLCGHLPAQRRSPPASFRRLSVVMGPCAGGAVYSPAMTDFIVMVEGTSYMFVTGPERGEGRHPRRRRFRGARRRHRPHDQSGVAHLAAADEAEALDQLARHPRLPATEQHRGPAAVAGPIRSIGWTRS